MLRTGKARGEQGMVQGMGQGMGQGMEYQYL
jgi:hypothetical protein